MNDILNDLVAVSREYGADPQWVVAGGGNTSLKVDDILYVKASGFPLATIDEGGFARMDRSKLAAIWNTDYPAGEDTAAVAERERLVLADMMAACVPGEEKRPSVEALLHDLLPWPLIVHLHPTLVNGLTCGMKGQAIAGKLFGEAQEWIPVTDPGYVLAKVIKDTLENRTARSVNAPDFIFLANHGVFVGGADIGEIREKYSRLKKSLEDRLVRSPDALPVKTTFPGAAAQREILSKITSNFFGVNLETTLVSGGELEKYLPDADAAAPLIGSLTPDHIVYAGPGALYLEAGGSLKEWETAAKSFSDFWGKSPNIILLGGNSENAGAFVAASGEKALDNAVLLLGNALEVCAFTESFGGPLLLDERFIRFIVDWEVENYRSKLASI